MTAPYTEALGATIRIPGQHERRATMLYLDQHAREWSTEIELKTMQPCVPMTPAGWRSPFPVLTPPDKYFRFRKGLVGRTTIDYDQWLIDAADDNREYDSHLMEMAKRMFGARAVDAIRDRDRDLLKAAGPAPAAMDFVRAMKAGNKWALGILKADGTRYPMPPWAEPIIDTLRRIETYGGTDVALEADLGEYPDVEDDVPITTAPWARETAEYLDLEEAVDPFAAKAMEPIKRGRGRPRKVLTDD